jgi:hypothetical protein
MMTDELDDIAEQNSSYGNVGTRSHKGAKRGKNSWSFKNARSHATSVAIKKAMGHTAEPHPITLPRLAWMDRPDPEEALK